MTKFSPNPAGHCARVLLAASAVLAGSLIALPAAVAQTECTLNNWSESSGTIDTGTPNDGIIRYTSSCAAMMPAGAESFVQDNNPNGIDRIRAQFYVFNDLVPGEGAPLIYAGFGNTSAGDRRFRVRLAASGLVNLIDETSNQVVQQSGNTKWLSIQIDWQQGTNGSMSLSVNGQEPVVENGLSNAGPALQSVRLGVLNAVGEGFLNFDAYQSHRTTEIPRLCEGDAFPDGVRDFADINAIFVEFATGGSNPAQGNPDINGDGLVDFADINEVFILFATGQGECP